MTKNKDLKARVRTRMKKTGESYAAARRRFSEPFSGDVKLWLDQDDGRCNLPKILHKGPFTPGAVHWGYGGSGPQDLALSILATYFPGIDVALFNGTCSQLAMALHVEFLEDFLLNLPEEGGVIREEEIRIWVEQEMTRKGPRPVQNPTAHAPSREELAGKDSSRSGT